MAKLKYLTNLYCGAIKGDDSLNPHHHGEVAT